jgi:Metallo-beta-lactamase superfamily
MCFAEQDEAQTVRLESSINRVEPRCLHDRFPPFGFGFDQPGKGAHRNRVDLNCQLRHSGKTSKFPPWAQDAPRRYEPFGPSTLVEAGGQKFIFDAGRGALQRLNQIKVPWQGIDGVFLTHLHSDHVVGFPDLWLTGWLVGGQAGIDHCRWGANRNPAHDVVPRASI